MTFRFLSEAILFINIGVEFAIRLILETIRHLKTRDAEHRGLLTGFPLKSSDRRNIFFSIFLECGHEILPDNFSIMQSAKDQELKSLKVEISIK